MKNASKILSVSQSQLNNTVLSQDLTIVLHLQDFSRLLLKTGMQPHLV